ncbi:retropepsin-like aspartic protease [Flavivirga spongiicola]|uniref:PDZ domain-containing protein n=1 Tax=Flavivirga spongiicola TaxID=421621 RepID=A0ABU7XX10_9FLAO|nr:PDZ domain-containing protein [Flavivirga sp. MEBiC05379]MDO5979955.1 PDZ domain-containing protein [Flavivirga sp. MEBiC05379]
MKIVFFSIKKLLTLILVFFCFSNLSFSQNKFVIQNKNQSDRVKFKLINNLIIIPVEVNGVSLSFLLDTGVSKPIIFNFLNVSDTLKIKDTETIFLRGLGEGESVEALKSKNNVFKIGEAIKLNQDLYAVYDSNLNFAPRLGFPVHGIIGFDLFRDLVVEINYSKKVIKLTAPEKYRYKKCKKCERLNLEFYNSKPYINAEVTMNRRKIPVKLLIDSGGSDSLWLFEDDSLGIESSNKYFYDFLGHGLSGSVYGKRSKVRSFSLKSFQLNKVNVSFPDSTFILFARKHKSRNGSLSGNILKRFNVIFDYRNAIITLTKNHYFNEKFQYNKSGIELAHDGFRLVREKDNLVSNDNGLGDSQEKGTKIIIDPQYKLSLKPAYAIVELRKNSPAEKAGLLKGDIILSINNRNSYQFTLQELIHMFYGEAGKRIKLKIERDKSTFTFQFQLENLFQ